MGCVSDRLSSEVSVENILKPFQDGLGLNKHRSVFIDNAVHRYSANFKLGKNQLSYLFKVLNLENASSFASLLENPYFCLNDSHDSIKISCLGILLGNGIIKEKAELIFQNYDIDLSKSLKAEEVRQMLRDIFTICNKVLIEFTFSNLNEKERLLLENYSSELMKAKSKVIVGYLDLFFDKKKKYEISQSEFVGYFHRADTLCLINPKHFREHTYKMLISMEKIIKNIEIESTNEISDSPQKKQISRAKTFNEEAFRRRNHYSNKV